MHVLARMRKTYVISRLRNGEKKGRYSYEMCYDGGDSGGGEECKKAQSWWRWRMRNWRNRMNRMRGGAVRPGNDFLFWGASSWRESRQKSPAQEQKRVLNDRTSKTKKTKKKSMDLHPLLRNFSVCILVCESLAFHHVIMYKLSNTDDH